MVTVPAEFNGAIAAGKPQRMVFQFANRIISNEDIDMEVGVDFHEIFCSETDLTIGLTPSSEISFTVFNDDGYYSDFEFGTFTAYLGVLTGSTTNDTTVSGTRPDITIDSSNSTFTVQYNYRLETYTYIKLGVFIAPRPAIVDIKEIAIDANDRMTLFDEDMPSAGDLGITTYPLRADTMLQALCNKVGVTAASYTFLNHDATIASWPDSFSTATMREVVGQIAELACSNARFNREGLLELVWLQTTSSGTYGESNYTEYSPYWYGVPQITSLHVRNADSTTETVVGTSGNEYMIQGNPWLKR